MPIDSLTVTLPGCLLSLLVLKFGPLPCFKSFKYVVCYLKTAQVWAARILAQLERREAATRKTHWSFVAAFKNMGHLTTLAPRFSGSHRPEGGSGDLKDSCHSNRAAPLPIQRFIQQSVSTSHVGRQTGPGLKGNFTPRARE